MRCVNGESDWLEYSLDYFVTRICSSDAPRIGNYFFFECIYSVLCSISVLCRMGKFEIIIDNILSFLTHLKWTPDSKCIWLHKLRPNLEGIDAGIEEPVSQHTSTITTGNRMLRTGQTLRFKTFWNIYILFTLSKRMRCSQQN